MKKIFRQNTVEYSNGDIETIEPLSASFVFNSPKLRPNPFAGQGEGAQFLAPRHVGIKNKYSYVGTDGEVYEAEYIDPSQVVEDRQTGRQINKTKISLVDGTLVVPQNNPGLYQFLHEHPENGAFEFRDSAATVKMVEVPQMETPQEREVRLELAQKAQMKVLGLSNDEVLDALDLFSLDVSGGKSVRKDRLSMYAKENPKVILSIEKKETTLYLVEKAMDSKVIYFASVNKTFNWNKSFEDTDNTILKSEGGKDLEYLSEYFDDNKELLAQLKMRV